MNTVVLSLQLMASDVSVIFKTKKSGNAHTVVEEGDNGFYIITVSLFKILCFDYYELHMCS
jgi:hypothetical protein